MKPWAHRLLRQFLPPQQAITNWRYHLALCGNCREETRPILDLRCESTRAAPDTLLSVTRSAINRLATTLAPTDAMLQGHAKRAQPTFAIIRKIVSPTANLDTRWVGDAAAATRACYRCSLVLPVVLVVLVVLVVGICFTLFFVFSDFVWEKESVAPTAYHW